jgi:hypothetical protein
MKKNNIFWALAGWLISLLFPPSALFGMLKGVLGHA